MSNSWFEAVHNLFFNIGRASISRRRYRLSASCELLESRQLLSASQAEVSFAGRGEDLLLVVNPNDENALRVANAYQQLRHIPDRNILFLEPPLEFGFVDMSLEPEQFLTSIVTPIANAIQERGLSSQVDFIGAIGLPIRFRIENPANFGSTSFQSLSYGLMQLTQYANGLDPALAQFVRTAVSTANSNSAIHHSQSFTVTYNQGAPRATQYYLGGLVGFTGAFGNTADQVISNLNRTAAADGTRPVGTIYFEENDDIRSNTREPQWPAAQTALQSRGIPFVQESDLTGGTPSGRSDVRGAVVGTYEPLLPNGSTYLPGSWADHLTSYGGAFGPDQGKATQFLAAGAAGTSGTVEEPFARADRFVSASIFTSIDDGLTLAEAYAHSIARPDMSQFFGDLLAQPYADLPQVQFTAGPTEGQLVSGTLSLTAAASLNQPRVASAISRLELYIDGVLRQTINASQGTFNPNTSTLSDGVHELRVVAVNNAPAQSEGIAIRHVIVNNRGRSITATPPHTELTHHEVLPVAVTTQLNSGSVQRIELRHLGRTIGELAGGNGNINLDASRLAFGENIIVPVAVFADGEQVSGLAFTVNRSPEVISAQQASNPVDRTAGIRAEYFLNNGAATIDASDFSGTPDIVRLHDSLFLTEQELATSSIDHLAIRFTGRFHVAGDAASEYLFTMIGTNDSARLTVDGRRLVSFDDLSYGVYNADGSASVFLAPGEHTFELLLSNIGLSDPGMRVDLRMRGPDGVTRIVDSSSAFVTSDIPTPNRAPTTIADAYQVTKGQTLDVSGLGVLANDTDPDGDSLAVRIGSTPAHGTVTLQTNGTFSYVPSSSYVGPDQFTYIANDGQVDSAVTTVAIDVQADPDPVGDFTFQDDFESQEEVAWQIHLNNESGFNIPGTGGFTEIGQGTSIELANTENAKSGQKALQVTYVNDEDRGQAIVQIPNGAGETVRTTQSMRFGETFDFGFGMKIHRLFSYDAIADASAFDIVVVAWGKSLPGLPERDLTGVNDSYLVSINYNGGPNDWGAEYADFSFERGRWYELVTEVKLNTIGESDGEVRLWIDGVLLVEKTGLVIRTQAVDSINRVLFGGWYSNSAGGENPAPNTASETQLLIDDVAIVANAGTPVEPTPGIIEFEQSSQSVNESDGSVTLTLIRRDGSSGAVDVNYTTQSGTATSNSDFTAKSGQVHFADGETSKTIVVALLNDSLVEVNEAFQVQLTAVTGGAALGSVTVANVSIQDNDVVGIAPRIVSVSSVTSRRKVTALRIRFDSPMNAVTVNNKNAYQLLDAGVDGRFGTRGDKAIGIRSITYSGLTNTATLTLTRAAKAGRLVRIEIPDGALRGVNLLALDGDANGQAGGKYRKDFQV